MNLENLFEELRVQDFNDPNAMSVLREIILYALNRFRVRSWALFDKKDQAQIYNFLRWYVRIILLFFVTNTSENMQNNQGSFGYQSKVHDSVKKALLDLILLENRIHNSDRPSEGIRIVKEEKISHRSLEE